MIFHTIKWVGVAYVTYLAIRMVLSAMKAGDLRIQTVSTRRSWVSIFN